MIEAEHVNVTQEGIQALIKLSRGDMRKALNIMQSVHGAYNLVTEETVYACVGAPQPRDVEQVVQALMERDFQGAHEVITALKVDRGLAVGDLVQEVFAWVQANLQLPRASRVYLVKELADIENRVSSGCSEKLQTSALISAFQISKDVAI